MQTHKAYRKGFVKIHQMDHKVSTPSSYVFLYAVHKEAEIVADAFGPTEIRRGWRVTAIKLGKTSFLIYS